MWGRARERVDDALAYRVIPGALCVVATILARLLSFLLDVETRVRTRR